MEGDIYHVRQSKTMRNALSFFSGFNYFTNTKIISVLVKAKFPSAGENGC